MQKKFLPLILTLLAVTLWATTAPASTIFFTADIPSFSVSVDGFAMGDAGNAAYIAGDAYNPPESWYDDHSGTNAASISHSGSPWLTYMKAENSFTPGSPSGGSGSMYVELQGTGPQPSSPGNFDGYISQWGGNSITIPFNVTKTGQSLVTYSGSYDLFYGLSNNSSGNPFYEAYFSAWIDLYIDGNWFKTQQLIYDGSYNYPLPLGDFTNNPTGTTSFGGNKTFTTTGTHNLEIYFEADQWGSTMSPIPLPGTLLLLGSGLLGLAGLGYRRIK